MLDLKFVVDNTEEVVRRLSRRSGKINLAELIACNEERKRLIRAYDDGRFEQRQLSEAFKDKSTPIDEQEAAREKLKTLSASLKQYEAAKAEIESKLEDMLYYLPNMPHDSVPDGKGSDDNVEIRRIGQPRAMDFQPRDHVDLGEQLQILDFPAAAAISGARFVVYRGAGAYLERALMMFMLDLHTREHGYTEVLAPFLVQRHTMIGTGQLPKFEDDAFRTEDDYFLIPTAEVSVTNLHREQMFDPGKLPTKYVSYSSCFRREAGSYGKDTRGLTRLHQFQKVELVKLAHPDESFAELESLVTNAEEVLKRLELPYRVMLLCAGDMGFGSTKTYDLEVWLPGQNQYREISSCSNYADFQARRANMRFRAEPGAKPRYIHTLNGSGLAIGRTVMAILENYQQADGTIAVPAVLRPYMGGLDVIR
ncbi:MAG: serine--tRNA ligase [Myxococcales bacterium]|nr:serine--tRNA ligase [Myxococcales bacterium]